MNLLIKGILVLSLLFGLGITTFATTKSKKKPKKEKTYQSTTLPKIGVVKIGSSGGKIGIFEAIQRENSTKLSKQCTNVRNFNILKIYDNTIVTDIPSFSGKKIFKSTFCPLK